MLCYGTRTGSLSVLNPNTNPNFSYNWENINVPGVSVGTGAVVNNLPAGVYVLESQYGDSLNFGLSYEGCTNRDTVEITQIDEIVVMLMLTMLIVLDRTTEVYQQHHQMVTLLVVPVLIFYNGIQVVQESEQLLVY